jgi:hypothetical protein
VASKPEDLNNADQKREGVLQQEPVSAFCNSGWTPKRNFGLNPVIDFMVGFGLLTNRPALMQVQHLPLEFGY